MSASPDPKSAARTLHLVDASPYIFRAFFSLPTSITDPGGAPVNAVRGFGDFLGRLLRGARPTHLLVAFDGTWKEAREMHAKSLQALPSHAITVKLNENKKVEDAHNLRVEPDESCTLTALAAARAVAALEAEYGGDATKVRTATQRVVNHIIGIQRMFDPAMQPHITKHLGGGKRQRVGGNHGANSAKGGQVSDL